MADKPLVSGLEAYSRSQVADSRHRGDRSPNGGAVQFHTLGVCDGCGKAPESLHGTPDGFLCDECLT